MKALKVVLALTILLALGLSAVAEGQDFDMVLADRGVLSVYHGEGGAVTVPAVVGEDTSRVLSGFAFTNSETVTSITFEGGIEIIELSSIFNMPALESVFLPDTLQVLGNQNFVLCPQLTEIILPASLRFIGRNALSEDAALRRITFLGEVPFIGEGSFELLPDDLIVYVPNDRVESYRAALPEGINIVPSGQECVVVDTAADDADFAIDDGGVITAYYGQDPVLDIPAEINGIHVTALGESLFEKNIYLYAVNLPDGLKTVGPRAFNYASNIAQIALPDSVTEIGPRAFEYCSLDITHWPASLETIGEDAFHSCQLSSEMTLPEGLKDIGPGAFRSSYVLSTVLFPASVEIIGEKAFAASTSLNYLIFSSAELPGIANNAFEGSHIADIDLPMDATKAQAAAVKAAFEAMGQPDAYVWRAQNPDIPYANSADSTYEDGLMTSYFGDQAAIKPYDSFDDVTTTGLADSALKGNGVVKVFGVPHNDAFTTIGNEAFMDSALTEVDMFDTVTDIGDRAFANCHGLKTLTLPESLEHISPSALQGCDGLTTLNVLCDPAILPAGLLKDGPAVTSLTLGADLSDAEIKALMYRLGAIDSLLDETMKPFEGLWYGIWMDAGIMKGDPRTMWNMEITLALNADGTGALDFVEPDEGKTWFVQDGVVRYGDETQSAALTLAEDGLMTYTQPDGGQIVFSRSRDEVYYKAETLNARLNTAVPADEQTEEPTQTPTERPTTVPTAEPVVTAAAPVNPLSTSAPTNAPAPANPQAPATPIPAAPATLKTDTRYACIGVTIADAEFTPDEIGGDCAVVFYEDGHCDLVIAGRMDETGPTWAVDGWSGTMVVTSQGEKLVFEPTEEGCDLDYRGIMTLHYVEEDE